MARINLLPWREELRKEKTKEFGILLGAFILLAAIVVGLGHFYYVQLIDQQTMRNRYLDAEIAKLDKKIKEIQALTKERDRLIARMRAIEELQGNRPLIVRFFDALIESLPEGVSVTEVKQSGDRITILGEAQSNARVSSFMRNLETSEWLRNPQLDIIQTKDAQGLRISAFTLRFSQTVPKASEEDA